MQWIFCYWNKVKIRFKLQSYNFNVEHDNSNDRYVFVATATAVQIHRFEWLAIRHQKPRWHARGPHPRWPSHPVQKIGAEFECVLQRGFPRYDLDPSSITSPTSTMFQTSKRLMAVRENRPSSQHPKSELWNRPPETQLPWSPVVLVCDDGARAKQWHLQSVVQSETCQSCARCWI